MYVIIQPDSGRIYAFGATLKKASTDYVRRDIWYDGPPLETHRCSPALYRLLKAKARDGTALARCRITGWNRSRSLQDQQQRRRGAAQPRTDRDQYPNRLIC
jgi:hypothetical protein